VKASKQEGTEFHKKTQHAPRIQAESAEVQQHATFLYVYACICFSVPLIEWAWQLQQRLASDAPMRRPHAGCVANLSCAEEPSGVSPGPAHGLVSLMRQLLPPPSGAPSPAAVPFRHAPARPQRAGPGPAPWLVGGHRRPPPALATPNRHR